MKMTLTSMARHDRDPHDLPARPCEDTAAAVPGPVGHRRRQGERDRHMGFRGSPEPPGRLVPHLHTMYILNMEYSECISILLKPMAEWNCLSQVGATLARVLREGGARALYKGLAAPLLSEVPIGFGRIVVSEKEVPILLLNLV
jgi:hypothetical protein